MFEHNKICTPRENTHNHSEYEHSENLKVFLEHHFSYTKMLEKHIEVNEKFVASKYSSNKQIRINLI